MSNEGTPETYTVPVTAEEIDLQVSFVLGQTRRSELRDWLGKDLLKSEAARGRIVRRIVARLMGWQIRRQPAAPTHSVPPAGSAAMERMEREAAASGPKHPNAHD